MILSVIRHFAEAFVILGSEFFKMLILYYSSSTRLGPIGNLNTWMKNYHIVQFCCHDIKGLDPWKSF